MARTTLTPKQRVFVDEYVKNKGNGTQAALKAYDTDDYNTAHVIAVENLQKPTIRTITEHLFPIEKTQQVVDNLHKLSISAESQETQVKATKEYLDRALPKTDSGSNINVNIANVVNSDRDKYGL